MKALLVVALVIVLAVGARPDAAAEAGRQLKWADLLPAAEKFDDPYASLSTEQKVDLSVIAVTRQRQARGEAPAPKQFESAEAAAARLKQARVDVDALLARRAEIAQKRRQAAEAVNVTLNGQRIRMAGYLLPLETDGRKVTEFLLVPYVGACIHAPTPPPNQIVHVMHAAGFETSGSFAPVWVQGVLRTARSEPQLSLVDGSANIPTGYALEANVVEPYRE